MTATTDNGLAGRPGSSLAGTATNIAEDVFFIVEASDVRHHAADHIR